ncbi:MAG: 23S rRNA (uracil(1939)-C(5))-methyltransferase RlmD [Bacteroidia bacterium]|nr:23S rRNA (uracil(1939)-C(5))-methyltransferase RlmD [Bacteroidia bacterium]MDW8015683.1 23S rRNA (uracil(1939)-C(5))-methyltransferase RlmD [Bacteroidia bacterium]
MILERQVVLDLASEGFGVLHPNQGPVVFVPFTIEGEVIDVQITKRKRQFWYGEAIAWHSTSPARVSPLCLDFGRCGGCRWQMMSYFYQLSYKRRFVEESFRRIAHLPIQVPLPVPSPCIWRYRNKVEYAFGKGLDGTLALGFHPRGDFATILPIQNCQIVPEIFEKVRMIVKNEAQRLGLMPYDPRHHKGLLRTLLLRGTPNQLVAILSLSEDRPEIVETLFAPLRGALKGYGYFYNPKRNESIHDLVPHTLYGTLTLEYEVAGRRYSVGPKDFFQVNLSQAGRLVEWIRERIEGRIPLLYDLYGGVGFFGVALADKADYVCLVEKLPEAVVSAEQNFKQNQSAFPQTKWRVETGSVEQILERESIKLPSGSVAILDPPREGIHPRLRRFLNKVGFDWLFYVSCHPATQARDVADLLPVYEVVEVQPFDFFPHTTSIENVVVLKRRDSF